MRGILVIIVTLFGGFAMAEDKDKFAQRAGPVIVPLPHTAERAGTDRPVKNMSPSVTSRNALGYVNNMTFGMDNSLFGRFPGRLFPGLWPDGHKQTSYSHRYATEGEIHVPDVLALKPIKKAVNEAKNDKKPAVKE
ncbi:hypothetical protein BH11PLA2_BH11PLA2_34980 [soil metagenome]